MFFFLNALNIAMRWSDAHANVKELAIGFIPMDQSSVWPCSRLFRTDTPQ